MSDLNSIKLNLNEFEHIDDSAQSRAYVEALEIFDQAKGIQELKALSLKKMQIKPGDSILDVGCGIGLETIRLAKLVQPSGSVIGVDLSETFLHEARTRCEALNMKINFKQANAEQLPFSDHQFDCCRAERLLLYVDNPEQALKEFKRVTKPNGYISLIEPDWETNTINTTDRSLTRRILHHDCDTHIRNGWIGRELPYLLKTIGITTIDIETRVVLIDPQLAKQFYLGLGEAAYNVQQINAREYQYWNQEINHLYNKNNLFCTISYFLYIGKISNTK